MDTVVVPGDELARIKAQSGTGQRDAAADRIRLLAGALVVTGDAFLSPPGARKELRAGPAAGNIEPAFPLHAAAELRRATIDHRVVVMLRLPVTAH